MERAEIVSKLIHIGRLIRDQMNNYSVRQPFDTWITQFLPKCPTKPSEPEPRQKQDLPPTVQSDIPSDLPGILIVVLDCFIGIPWLLMSALNNLVDSPDNQGLFVLGIIVFLVLLFLGIIIIASHAYKKKNPPPGPYRDYLERCKEIQNYNEEVEKWNGEVFPGIWSNYQAQLNQYNTDYTEWEQSCTRIREEKRPEFDAWIVGLDEELNRINTELSELSSFLHKDYWQNADELADLIEKGRADSVKEAINLFVQERNERQRHYEMMQAQREATEENARRAEEWHKEEVEAAERRHNDLLAAQQRIAEAQEAAAVAQRRSAEAQEDAARYAANAASSSSSSNTSEITGHIYCANCARANTCGSVGHGTEYCFIARE